MLQLCLSSGSETVKVMITSEAAGSGGEGQVGLTWPQHPCLRKRKALVRHGSQHALLVLRSFGLHTAMSLSQELARPSALPAGQGQHLHLL